MPTFPHPQEIEKAAKDAIGQDRAEYGDLFKASSSRPPPPPPSRPRDPNAVRRPGAGADDSTDDINKLREDSSGISMI